MNSPKNNLILAVAAVLLIAGWFFYQGSFSNLFTGHRIYQNDLGLKTYDKATLPPNIPTDLPNISNSATVTTNTSFLSFLNPVGSQKMAMTQSTRTLMLGGTLAQYEQTYKDYMTRKGYTVTSTSSATSLSLGGKKGSNVLSILISNYKMPPGKVSVMVNFISTFRIN